jgi:hypothetical protein
MKEHDNLSKLREALLAQDSPSPPHALAHQEMLFKKIRRRMQIEKGLLGTLYVAIFVVAFWSFLQAGRVGDAAAAVWWTACSMHLLLWFLVFFLWRVERLTGRILPSAGRAGPTRGEHRAIFITALAVCVLGTAFLWRAGFVRDPLKAIQASGSILWAPVFFLFWYPFGIATAVSRLWLKFKELELKQSSSEKAGGSPLTENSSLPDQ